MHLYFLAVRFLGNHSNQTAGFFYQLYFHKKSIDKFNFVYTDRMTEKLKILFLASQSMRKFVENDKKIP